MQIVIDIKDELYAILQKEKEQDKYLDLYERAILNGIPLQKGHGDLIDREALECDTEYDFYSDGYIAYSKSQIMSAQAIIKADKEET